MPFYIVYGFNIDKTDNFFEGEWDADEVSLKTLTQNEKSAIFNNNAAVVEQTLIPIDKILTPDEIAKFTQQRKDKEDAARKREQALNDAKKNDIENAKAVLIKAGYDISGLEN